MIARIYRASFAMEINGRLFRFNPYICRYYCADAAAVSTSISVSILYACVILRGMNMQYT